MINKKTLHIACWKINGYKVKGYSKYSDPGFIYHIRNKDIICLLETHCPFQESLILPNFSAVHLSRPKNKKTNTISGGISVFVKSELKLGIQFLEHMIIFGLSFVKAVLVFKMIFIYVTYIIPQKILLILSH
jgi:hypothetical protein